MALQRATLSLMAPVNTSLMWQKEPTDRIKQRILKGEVSLDDPSGPSVIPKVLMRWRHRLE
jgi:hypothetical protein